jgi:hypothetical protein
LEGIREAIESGIEVPVGHTRTTGNEEERLTRSCNSVPQSMTVHDYELALRFSGLLLPDRPGERVSNTD